MDKDWARPLVVVGLGGGPLAVAWLLLVSGAPHSFPSPVVPGSPGVVRLSIQSQKRNEPPWAACYYYEKGQEILISYLIVLFGRVVVVGCHKMTVAVLSPLDLFPGVIVGSGGEELGKTSLCYYV